MVEVKPSFPLFQHTVHTQFKLASSQLFKPLAPLNSIKDLVNTLNGSHGNKKTGVVGVCDNENNNGPTVNAGSESRARVDGGVVEKSDDCSFPHHVQSLMKASSLRYAPPSNLSTFVPRLPVQYSYLEHGVHQGLTEVKDDLRPLPIFDKVSPPILPDNPQVYYSRIGAYCDSLLNRDKHFWTDEETDLMLELYEINNHYFTDPKTKKTKVWGNIAKIINAKFFSAINAEQCSQKFRNMKAEFFKTQSQYSKGVPVKLGRHFHVLKRLLTPTEDSPTEKVFGSEAHQSPQRTPEKEAINLDSSTQAGGLVVSSPRKRKWTEECSKGAVLAGPESPYRQALCMLSSALSCPQAYRSNSLIAYEEDHKRKMAEINECFKVCAEHA